MSNKIKSLYEQLYHSCGRKDLDGKSVFVSMRGRKYEQPINGVKLMLVGRAANGWPRIDSDFETAEQFGEACANNFMTSHFSWVSIDDRGRYYSLNNDAQRYYLNRSAFWRTSEKIWSQLTSATETEWLDYIAWSNLYKISPEAAGNPSTGLCSIQREACISILKEEIKAFSPTHLLFITGKDWWVEFNSSNLFCDVDKNCLPEGFIEATAYYQSDNNRIPVVVSCRPERKKEQHFVNEVCACFRRLNKSSVS